MLKSVCRPQLWPAPAETARNLPSGAVWLSTTVQTPSFVPLFVPSTFCGPRRRLWPRRARFESWRCALGLLVSAAPPHALTVFFGSRRGARSPTTVLGARHRVANGVGLGARRSTSLVRCEARAPLVDAYRHVDHLTLANGRAACERAQSHEHQPGAHPPSYALLRAVLPRACKIGTIRPRRPCRIGAVCPKNRGESPKVTQISRVRPHTK